MKRTLWVGLLLVLAGGWCGLAWGGNFMAGYYNPPCPDGCSTGVRFARGVPGMVGPWGQPVDMVFPYTMTPPNGESAARDMLAQSVPFDLQMALMAQAGGPPPPLPGGVGGSFRNGMGPGSLPGTGPTPPGLPSLPPGMTGTFTTPGGGVMQAGGPGISYDGGLQLTQVQSPSPKLAGPTAPFPVQRTEVRFSEPAGMKVSWYTTQADGKPGFTPAQQSLEVPGRYNFLQAAIYRLKLSDIPNRPTVELYPTLEVVPANSRTSTFLAHSAVPVSFTPDDFEQVAAGNLVTKVIYLPDPAFQDLATTGLGEVVSTQLLPGMDAIAETQRRGSILLVIRLGNIDLEAPNTPPMDAPSPPGSRPTFGPPPGQNLNMQPLMPSGPSRMIPYGAVPNPNARPPANYQAGPQQQQQQGGNPNPQAMMPPLPPGAYPYPGPGPGGMQPMPGYPPQGMPTARPGVPNPMLQPGQALPPGQFVPPGQFNPGPNTPPLQGSGAPGLLPPSGFPGQGGAAPGPLAPPAGPPPQPLIPPGGGPPTTPVGQAAPGPVAPATPLSQAATSPGEQFRQLFSRPPGMREIGW